MWANTVSHDLHTFPTQITDHCMLWYSQAYTWNKKWRRQMKLHKECLNLDSKYYRYLIEYRWPNAIIWFIQNEPIIIELRRFL